MLNEIFHNKQLSVHTNLMAPIFKYFNGTEIAACFPWLYTVRWGDFDSFHWNDYLAYQLCEILISL